MEVVAEEVVVVAGVEEAVAGRLVADQELGMPGILWISGIFCALHLQQSAENWELGNRIQELGFRIQESEKSQAFSEIFLRLGLHRFTRTSQCIDKEQCAQARLLLYCVARLTP